LWLAEKSHIRYCFHHFLAYFFWNLRKRIFMAGYHQYKECIDACLRCAAICNHCAASCTQEAHVQMMAECIRLDMECAAICYAAAQMMSMGNNSAMTLCSLCADICESCAAECSKHENEHCRECADACMQCADACRKMSAR